VRRCYAPDATLWFNFSNQTVDADSHIRNVGTLQSKISRLRYDEIRVTPFEGGYVQQHVVRGDLADGRKIEIPACFVVKLRDGLIGHREEYIDSAALAPLRE
jgi:ketosteroid isomerase-like protein